MDKARYYRVKGTVTFTGEWFVEIDEYVQTPKDAIEYVRSMIDCQEPENIIEKHKMSADAREVWVTDEDGERVDESPDSGSTEEGDRG